MCCYADPKAKRQFLLEMEKKRRKTFVAYKIVCRKDGGAPYGNQKFHPGINVPNRLHKKYNVRKPTGIHVFLDKDHWAPLLEEVLIPVVCHVNDVIRIGCTGQCVVKKIVIRRKDWKRAGIGKSSVN